MPGGLLQITTYGANDLYLTGTPQISFFKVVYRRYTNFAMESIELSFDDITNFDKESRIVIPKIGDLIHKIYLQITLPEIAIIRKLSSSIYLSQLTIAKNNYNIVQNFMKINIESYRNGIQQLNIINTTVEDVINAIDETINLDNYMLIKTEFINILVIYEFNKLSMVDVINKFKDSNGNIIPQTTKQQLNLALQSALILCNKVVSYYHNEIIRLQALYDDEINPITKSAWINRLGHFIIDNVTIYIGGLKIDKHYGDWLNIWYELSGNKTKIYQKMIGDIPELTSINRIKKSAYTLYIPLQFWFCKHNGLALPIISLQYHEVSLSVKFKKFSECYYYGELTAVELANPTIRLAKIKQLGLPNLDDYLENNNLSLHASLLVDYIYLDKQERRRFAQSSHEYLIEQLQLNEINNSEQLQQNIILDFIHSCKEIIWIAQNINNVTVNDGHDILYWHKYGGINYTSLEFHGKTRVPRLASSYFNYVQPYQYHYATPCDGINIYSFAIHPEEYQPSGIANLGRIPNVLLKLEFDTTLINTNNYFNIRVYAINYNILRFVSGMGGLAITIG